MGAPDVQATPAAGDAATLTAKEVRMLKALPELLALLQSAATEGRIGPGLAEEIERLGWSHDVVLINR
jgi:hypothetical protein